MRQPMLLCLQAGGGVFFDSAAGQSSMSFADSVVDSNYVDYSLAGNSHDGLGGVHIRTCRRKHTRAHEWGTEGRESVCYMFRWHLPQPLQL